MRAGGAAAQDVTVAGCFLVRAEGLASHVSQWVEPETGDKQFCDLECPEVTALHMCQFMSEGGTLLYPIIVGLEPCWQKHDRAEESGHERSVRDQAGGNLRRPLETNLTGNIIRERLQLG